MGLVRWIWSMLLGRGLAYNTLSGIRIGYYTQAASIWVANFFAPHEAPYIHTVTLLFLVAILVGVCSLARYEDTHVVEPYILMTVAYNVGVSVSL